MQLIATSKNNKKVKTQRITKKRLSMRKPATKKTDVSASYNKVKTFGGRPYTGMSIGRSHKWFYDKGEWKETKITPDLWALSYAVTKRRAGKAPEGSGAAVGTGYHWYIVAHQNVNKLNADDYSTSMSGLKFKLAYKRAATGKWSSSAGAQRKTLIKFLKNITEQLLKEPIQIEFDYDNKNYKGEAIPIAETFHDGVYGMLDITLNNEHLGIIRNLKSGWKMETVKDENLIKAIGDELLLWFE
jgi:hypothetical protein